MEESKHPADTLVVRNSKVLNTANGQAGYTIGTWKDANASDIEEYLGGAQRKFVKYKLNIFYLNRVSDFEHSSSYHLFQIVRLTYPTLLLQKAQPEAG
jgi:hypothetical protein